MNERIKQLALQADWRFSDKITGDELQPILDKRLEKFAELIVLECASVSLCIGSGDNETELLKHFGIGYYTQEGLDAAHERGVELAKKLRIE